MQDEKIVTILTPTYNRGGLLSRLYGSLLQQTQKNFEWLIVDDGSTDDTEKTISLWMMERTLSIRYIRKENGGKHTALNRGIREIETPLTFIVDSDDWLSKDAVETIQGYYERYCSQRGTNDRADKERKERLCGFSFLRVGSDGKVNEGEFPIDDHVAAYRDERINAGLLGDKAEVYLTGVLRQYPFPVFPGEKFLPEDAIWIRMSGPYQMVHANRRIYICDYLEGGLTKTGRYMKIYSPFGMMYRSAMYLADQHVCFRVRVKMMLLYHVYSGFAKERLEQGHLDEKEYLGSLEKCAVRKNWLYWLMVLPGRMIYCRWRKTYWKRS